MVLKRIFDHIKWLAICQLNIIKKNKAKKKGIKIFLKKKEKSNIIVMKDTKTFLNMENKG